MKINLNGLIGKYNILFIVLDSLRYDCAVEALDEGRTPFIKSLIPRSKWERRYTTGCFTYPAHHSFFAGFLPVPVEPGIHKRLFASSFSGSQTIDENTFVFDESDIVSALSKRDYRTICIGGVGFFNKTNELSMVFPSMFDESYWTKEFGVTDPRSTYNQVSHAVELIKNENKNIFLYLNISALHQPSCIFSDEKDTDSKETQKDALSYVDSNLKPLFDVFETLGHYFCIMCSDHGTLFGEDGHTGHRIPHEKVMTVPYSHFTSDKNRKET